MGLALPVSRPHYTAGLRSDDAIHAITQWKNLDHAYCTLHASEEEAGAIDPSPICDAAFELSMAALERATGTTPTTLSGIAAFLEMMVEADFSEDPDNLARSLTTLSRAVQQLLAE